MSSLYEYIRLLLEDACKPFVNVHASSSIINSDDKKRSLEAHITDKLKILTRIGAAYDISIDVKSDKESRLDATIKVVPTKSAQYIECKMHLGILANSIYYVINEYGKSAAGTPPTWFTATLRDIYRNDYVPIFAIIGCTAKEWEIVDGSTLRNKFPDITIDDAWITECNIELLN